MRRVPGRFFAQNGLSRETVIEALREIEAPGATNAVLSSNGLAGSTVPPHGGFAERRRWVLAIGATGVTAIVALWAPSSPWWPWIMDHPNSLAIRTLAVLFVALLGATYAHRKWQEGLVTACLGALVVLLSLLGH